MQRINGLQRSGWEQLVLQQGLVYSPTPKPDGSIYSYWKEGPYYSLNLSEITLLETAAKTIFEMLIEAGDYVVAHPEIMKKMAIPKWTWAQIIWNMSASTFPASVFGKISPYPMVSEATPDHQNPSKNVQPSRGEMVIIASRRIRTYTAMIRHRRRAGQTITLIIIDFTLWYTSTFSPSVDRNGTFLLYHFFK